MQSGEVVSGDTPLGALAKVADYVACMESFKAGVDHEALEIDIDFPDARVSRGNDWIASLSVIEF
jgi:hypothetical protein